MKFGIVGTRGHAAHVTQLVKELSPNADIVALSSAECTHDMQLLVLLCCDAVFVLSPDPTHIRYLRFLHERGYQRYIFCEKLPVTDIDDIDFIARAMNWRRTYFNFNLRHSHLVRECMLAACNGTLGDIISCTCVSTHGLAFKNEYGGSWRARATNPLHTVGCHWFDAMAWITHHSRRITRTLTGHAVAGLVDTCVASTEITPAGAVGHIVVSYAAPARQSFELVGTNGIISFQDGHVTVCGPRETHDGHGMYIPPPVISSFNDDIFGDSLLASVRYFLTAVSLGADMPRKFFDASIVTTRRILETEQTC